MATFEIVIELVCALDVERVFEVVGPIGVIATPIVIVAPVVIATPIAIATPIVIVAPIVIALDALSSFEPPTPRFILFFASCWVF